MIQNSTIRLDAVLPASVATPAFAATTALHCERLFDARSSCNAAGQRP